MSLTPLLIIAALLVAGFGAAGVVMYPTTQAPLSWLPLILATSNPARSSALTTRAPRTAGIAEGIRQR